MSIEVRGAEEFGALAKHLKEAGEKDLQKEFNKGIRDALNPVKDEIGQWVLALLPRPGGLAQLSRSRLRRKPHSNQFSRRSRAANSGHPPDQVGREEAGCVPTRARLPADTDSESARVGIRSRYGGHPAP